MTINLQSLSLADLFGKGATQTSDVLVIQKSSLVRLTPLPNNTAESLLVAILITALPAFSGSITTENGDVLTDETGQSIDYDNLEAFEYLKIIKWMPFQIVRNNQKYINNQIIVFLYDRN
ncbi:MAG: hypothetical protein V7K40_30025 [Nostoc sp.]|uniref:hypothetical protein n=1 Tax=Nostoc sp. TaxID=1180 RepID=UPI002FF58968